jgi:hypothetical protein
MEACDFPWTWLESKNKDFYELGGEYTDSPQTLSLANEDLE